MGVASRVLPGGSWLLEPEGRLDAAAVPELEAALRAALEGGAPALIVDLSRASYISSSGLKALLSAWRTLRRRGGRLVLAGLSPRVREVFEMIGFTQVFDIYSDVAAAEAELHVE